MITIAYITARKEPRFDWFVESLSSQLAEVDCGPVGGLNLLIIDFYAYERPIGVIPCGLTARWEKPKPNVWQGEHRLTSVDYFAAANARNTAICFAPDGWIVYVDDLSVLMPGWLEAVLRAMKREHTITLGSYEKVLQLEVENGLIKNCVPDPHGIDHRLSKANGKLQYCHGEWFYGSSMVCPVEALLSINGWDENCDGMGYEDVVTGQVVENAGIKLLYDPQMKTIESQELHQQPYRMLRLDKGISPNDKSHAALAFARKTKWCPNYFGAEGIRGLRARVLSGEPFPIVNIPEHDWYDSQPLREM